ncbi:MAG: deoxyguanosine kinase [Maribacter sp.]|jgi:deoxyguanosine kinase
MNIDIPYNFIAIEGNIGAGKTTLCNMLAKDWDTRLVLEQFSDNPFLPQFYQDAERHAFTVELFFMTERHKQLQEAFLQPDLFNPLTIADYFFIKTLLFAGQNLKENELQLFKRLFHILNGTFPKPDLLVYLHRPVEVLLENIAKRGRSYEKDITADYLTTIQNAYFDYFRTEASVPIIILDLGDKHFNKNSEIYEVIKNKITTKHKNGVGMLEVE